MRRDRCPRRGLRASPPTLLLFALLTTALDARAGAGIMKRRRPAERAAAALSPAEPAALAPPSPEGAPVAVATGEVVAAPVAVAENASTPPPSPPDEGAAPLPNDADDTEPLEPGVELKASTGVVHRSLRFYQDV